MREFEVTDQYWAVRALDFVTALEAASLNPEVKEFKVGVLQT